MGSKEATGPLTLILRACTTSEEARIFTRTPVFGQSLTHDAFSSTAKKRGGCFFLRFEAASELFKPTQPSTSIL